EAMVLYGVMAGMSAWQARRVDLIYGYVRERVCLVSVVDVGVLSALLGIEPEVIATLLGEQYKGKAKLIQPNLDAFMMGLQYGRQMFEEGVEDVLGLKVQRCNAVGQRIFIEGNAAVALGCVYGGATVCAWY